MLQPFKSGAELIAEIEDTITPTPALWWLGHAGFAIRFANITFYVDPCFSDLPGRERRTAAPLSGDQIRHADLILATHAHPGHLDAATLKPMLESSRRAQLVLPRSVESVAHAAGIPRERTRPTDNGLRIEYFRENLYGRIYAVPSAHPELDYTADGGYPYLGYLIRFGRWTIYHAGDCAMHEGLANRLKPFNVSVALLPIGGKNFSITEAAQLAKDIGASWLVPMHYGTFDEDRESSFVTHMLGHWPEQRFRVLQPGQMWTVPEE